ncbi:MAG: hypothetical protein RLZZ488_2814 [Pseudomonadota bacterium]|jgi:cytochrome c553
MEQLSPFDQYLTAELETERCKTIPKLATPSAESAESLAMWSVMAMLPSRLERVQLASSLHVSSSPEGSWALCTSLLQDSEQDVVGNAINSMTRARTRGFAHRAFHYLKSPERPQRILYCLARYCEEADDRRIAEQLAPTLASDLSDAYLARSFNALYKHGIKSDAALRVAMELVESHIDATNMDRKAAVAAITYLFFAGSKEHIEKLKAIQQRVTIPELRRLLTWGIQEIAHICQSQDISLGTLSAIVFWDRNLNTANSNYTGYGCFSSDDLLTGLRQLEKSAKLPSNPLLTEKILNLGDPSCSNWLAEHPKFGISNVEKDNDAKIAVWKRHATQKALAFLDSVLNHTNCHLWHGESPELLSLLLKSDILSNLTKYESTWLSGARSAQWKTALNIYLGSLLAIENLVINHEHSEDIFEKTIRKICSELKKLRQQAGNDESLIRNSVLGCMIGSPLSHPEIRSLVLDSMDAVDWWDIASAFLTDNNTEHIRSLLNRFESLARGSNGKTLSDKDVLSFARTMALSIVNSHPEKCSDELKALVCKTGRFVELLDPNQNVSTLAADSEDEQIESDESSQSATDWSGYTVVDRPIARWGVILGILFEGEDDSDKARLEERSQFLAEAMRTSPHVEKRWILRALASLQTDQAVKTILYQGLQHIDAEFVAQSIRELLPSTHPRAQQALIRCVGRNAISDDLKLNILEDININNPDEILQELRTLEILRLPQHIDDAVRDTVGRVAAAIDESQRLEPEPQQGKVVRLDGQDVDSTIRGLLPNHDYLTVDSRSALRTAEMILIQSRSWTQGGMDLSPIVNMHCKAVELVLRDSFEPFTDALLRKGQLSRKLDILGYARPIPEKMQVFEDTLASLPVIRSIPYFSKFKLRKMLRGVCLYRPGKRFTLDGPKAFALFFLVVSRQSCTFGLEKMLSLGFKSDQDLFEYIKLIHSLQDSRNRAVHEGLTWEAKDEIESMRAQAFKIIDISLKIKKHLSSSEGVSSMSGLGMGA